MTWKLEKATIGVPNLMAVIVAVSIGSMWAVSLAKDQRATSDAVKPVVAKVAIMETGQALLAQRMKTLEDDIKELKQDSKDGFKRILDKLDKK